MQEDIDNRTVTLTVNTAKLTLRTLARMVQKYMAYQKNKKLHPTIPQGKQSVKQLAKQGQGMTNIEITDKNIKGFERYARKYGVDFALKKDVTQTPPKYLVFFKGKDQDAITSAFKEFSHNQIKKASRPSAIGKLRNLAELVKNAVIDKTKSKHKEQSL